MSDDQKSPSGASERPFGCLILAALIGLPILVVSFNEKGGDPMPRRADQRDDRPTSTIDDSGSRSRSAPSRAWYQGGTLHRATLGEWRRASYANRLATASDIAVVFYRKRHGNDPPSIGGLRPLADRLVQELDAMAGNGALDSIDIAEAAASVETLRSNSGR